MNLNRLKKRVPSAVKISNGFIEGFCLECSKVSKDNSGKATVIKTNNKEDLVWGVLFEIDENQKPQLDRAEGLNFGYDESIIEVNDGKEFHKAQIYIANDKSVDGSLKPYNWYKAFITEGAKENRLPIDYVRKLDSLNSQQDENDKRRIKNENILKF
jgi:hypothetical protein